MKYCGEHVEIYFTYKIEEKRSFYYFFNQPIARKHLISHIKLYNNRIFYKVLSEMEGIIFKSFFFGWGGGLRAGGSWAGGSGRVLR